jgi:hypothetical protein
MTFIEKLGCGVLVVGARLPRASLLGGVAFAALPAGSALAATTIGQTRTPLSNNYVFGARELIQPSTAIGAAGVVTSFHTRSGKCNARRSELGRRSSARRSGDREGAGPAPTSRSYGSPY